MFLLLLLLLFLMLLLLAFDFKRAYDIIVMFPHTGIAVVTWTPPIARFMGPTWGTSGADRIPCWPHEFCYLRHFLHYWALVEGLHWWHVDSHHKGPVIPSFDGSLLRVWISLWTNSCSVKLDALVPMWRHSNVLRQFGFGDTNLVLLANFRDGLLGIVYYIHSI